jgi:hypothetical protein
MVMGLNLDPILDFLSGNLRRWISILTAPYFEICLTNRDANLNRGRGTMLNASWLPRFRLETVASKLRCFGNQRRLGLFAEPSPYDLSIPSPGVMV